MTPEEKKKQLEELRKNINKKFGAGTIAKAAEHTGAQMKRQQSGILSFDIASGGGMVYNTINLFYGKKSQGKSTIAMHTIAHRQRMGETCAYIYTEGILDETHLRTCGVDLDSLELLVTNSSEECVDLVQTLAMSKLINYIVVDSGQGLVPTRVFEAASQQHMGVQAYFIGQMCEMFTAATTVKADQDPWCTLTIIAQGAEPFGGGALAPKGGDKQQFFAVQMIEVKAGIGLKPDGGEIGELEKRAGYQLFFKFKKNKTFPPWKSGMIPYYIGDTNFGLGRGDMDHIFDIANCGAKYGIFKQSGAWIKYGDEKFNGKVAFSNYLRKMPQENLDALKEKILQVALKKEGSVTDDDTSFEEKTADVIADIESDFGTNVKETKVEVPTA